MRCDRLALAPRAQLSSAVDCRLWAPSRPEVRAARLAAELGERDAGDAGAANDFTGPRLIEWPVAVASARAHSSPADPAASALRCGRPCSGGGERKQEVDQPLE